MKISKMYVGIGSSENTDLLIDMGRVDLKPWGKKVTFHERLKRSYHILKDAWAGE